MARAAPRLPTALLGGTRVASWSPRGRASTLCVRSTAPAAEQGTQRDLYDVLGVAKTAAKKELKSAYRTLARQYHPDVNNSEDASAKFMELSAAYEVLFDDESRLNYDKYGTVDMKEHMRSGSAAWMAWMDDDMRVTKKETKFSRARDRAEDSMEAEGLVGGAGGEEGEGAEAMPGDVIEYPLAQHIRDRNIPVGDAREFGVALLVGRNKDRGDRHLLPPEKLDLCEVEPLWCEDPGSNRWEVDPLEGNHFARLGEMRVLRCTFDRRYDTWELIDEPCATGGGAP